MVETRSMSWDELKDLGRQSFSDGDYSESLEYYLEAIDRYVRDGGSVGGNGRGRNGGGYRNEHQMLLSNVIACRLKIGGREMNEKAVEEARRCIALNPRWSKAHVRLASAYIALGDHSNDACRSLQTALSLDRNNKVAREMLVREMRNRNNRESGENSAADGEGAVGSGLGGGSNQGGQLGGSQSRDEGSGAPAPSAPPSSDETYGGLCPTDETPPERRKYPNASAPPDPSSESNNPNDNANNSGGDGNGSNFDDVDVDDIDDLRPDTSHHSLSQRIRHHLSQVVTWFYSQSDDVQTLIKVVCVFLVLYVMLGGRFGLDYALDGGRGDASVGRRGNYERGNAYDRYSSGGTDRYRDASYNQQRDATYNQQQQQGQAESTGYNDRSSPQNDKYYSRYGGNEDYYEPLPGRQGSGTSWRLPNLYDGSMASMAIMLGIWFVCNRMGVNPFQVLMMVNFVQGRRGHHHGVARGFPGYGGYGGFGRGFGGMGRRRHGFGRRW